MEARVEKPHRIAGYCRISVDVEADRDNTSIENQKDIISDYVQRYFPDSELTFFVDRDRSGYTFEQREDYQRMRPYLMTGQYDVLIIKDLSRFSRRNSRGLVELEDLRDAGVRIVAIGDSIDYPTHDDWTNIRLRFLLNEMPVTDSSQKVKSVISRRQQDGRWICSVPYGYVMKNHINKVGLMNELTKIKNVMKKVVADAPHEVLLVLDGSTGQNAFEQAKQFTLATEVTAMAITKLDGTAKGGVVIGISEQFKIPVKYIGLGEGIEDMQVFRKKEFVDSLFGETE